MKLLRLSIVCLAGTLLFASCLKKKFEAPPDPANIDPMLPVNASIGGFSVDAMNNIPSGTYRVLGDSTVYGIVVGDDKSGNIYKKIYIQDSTGGMQIIIDRSNLNGDFPVGRKVYVKLRGLLLTNYKGTPELVYSYQPMDKSFNGIPSSLIGNYIIKASYFHDIKPKEVSASDLFTDPSLYANTLVKLTDMQFAVTSSDVMYSDALSSTNRYLEDCSHSYPLGMYNSNYATFQSAKTPTGNGSIVGIITLYQSGSKSPVPQINLRDTSDVKFTNPRCP